ncbi:MAG TPA: radical SAM protein [Candidatus Bathyarchaeia archaeon]|nr:radical SAM protein [Candidatus Bathyarchaeia archaeon]
MKKHMQTLLYYLWLDVKRIVFGTKYSAEFDVTDNCNLRCKHCYHFQSKEDIKTQDLETSVWEKRFNELYKSGIRAVLLVGGEPALRIDVLMLADKTFPLVYVITNGTIRIPEKFNHRLFVSIDGLPKTNDAIRGNEVFSRIMKNYSEDKRVIINMTLTMGNYKELEDVTRIAEENGFAGVVCNICAGGTDFGSSMTVRKKERAAIITEIKRVKVLYPKRFLMTKAMIKWYEYPDHRDECVWGDEALHFDVSWNKRRCFVSNADCSNCGCLAGAYQTPIKMMRDLREMMKMVAYP